MFGKYFDVGAKRDFMDAFFFFVVHLMLLVGFSSVLVHFFGMSGLAEGGGAFFDGGEIYTHIGTLFVIWLGASIVYKRGMSNDFMSMIIVGAGIFAAWTYGPILGLVPISLLTTVDTKSKG